MRLAVEPPTPADPRTMVKYAHLETGADMVVRHQGARAQRALGTRAAAPGHVINMLTDTSSSAAQLTT